MSYLPPELRRDPYAPPGERFLRRMEIASLLRRSRRLAGLSFGQVSLATMIDGPALARYERGYQYPSDGRTEHILATISRLTAEGVGDPVKAARAKAEYEAFDAGTGWHAE